MSFCPALATVVCAGSANAPLMLLSQGMDGKTDINILLKEF
jgi:hypothetical protein